MLRRIEQRSDGSHDNRRIQSVLDRQPDDAGVSHRLGHSDRRDRAASEGIAFKLR